MLSDTILTKDLSNAFLDGCKSLAKKLDCNVFELLGVMYYESGCSAVARNRNTGACGLIQFMPKTLVNLGWTNKTDFQLLTAEEQLPYVEKYFKPYGKLPSLTHVYCAVFMPAELSNAGDPNTTMSAAVGKRSWAYAVNASLDRNKDGVIRLHELADTVKVGCRGARWNEIVGRIGGRVPWALSESEGYSVSWVQDRLNAALPGTKLTVDGILGPRTTLAIRRFQVLKGLPKTGRLSVDTLKFLEGS